MENERLQPPPLTLLDRYRGAGIYRALYTTTVTVHGGEAEHGRVSGLARSDDGHLILDLRLPAALGGPGSGTNPEQLFAAGYAASFHGVLSLITRRVLVDMSQTTVAVEVSFGRDPIDGGYTLIAELRIRMPAVDRQVAEELVRDTEGFCPYAKMSREGIHSIVRVMD